MSVTPVVLVGQNEGGTEIIKRTSNIKEIFVKNC